MELQGDRWVRRRRDGPARRAPTGPDRRGRAGATPVVRWMREAGLSVRVDRIGNVFGRRQGTEPGPSLCAHGLAHRHRRDRRAPSTARSGCSAAIEVVRALERGRHATRRGVEVGFFTEEEGVRFGTDMLGSAVTAGRIPLERAYALTDARRRHRRRTSSSGIGFDGPEPRSAPRRTPTSSATSSRARFSPRPASTSASSPGCRRSPGSGSPSTAGRTRRDDADRDSSRRRPCRRGGRRRDPARCATSATSVSCAARSGTSPSSPRRPT